MKMKMKQLSVEVSLPKIDLQVELKVSLKKVVAFSFLAH